MRECCENEPFDYGSGYMSLQLFYYRESSPHYSKGDSFVTRTIVILLMKRTDSVLPSI